MNQSLYDLIFNEDAVNTYSNWQLLGSGLLDDGIAAQIIAEGYENMIDDREEK